MTPRTSGAEAIDGRPVEDNTAEAARLLSTLAAPLSAPLAIDAAYRAILRALVEGLGVERAEVYLLDDEGRFLTRAHAHSAQPEIARGAGTPAQAVRIALGEPPGVLAATVACGTPEVIEDLASDDGHRKLPAEIRSRLREGSLATLPLFAWGRVTGVILVHDPRRAGRLAARLPVLATFASQAGLAIERARLHEERDRALREIRGLHRVGAFLQAALPLEDVLRHLVEKMAEGLGADRISLFLYDSGRESLRGLQVAGVAAGDAVALARRLKEIEVPVSDPFEALAATVITRRGYDIPVVPESPGGLRLDRGVAGVIGSRRATTVPLIAGERVVGVALLDSPSPGSPAPPDPELLSAYGSQVGVAIERAQLEHELRASEKRYREFIERSPGGFVETAMDGRILSCNDGIASMLGYTREELLSMNACDLYVDPARRQDLLRGSLENGRVQGMEFAVRRKDGRIAYISLSSRVRGEGAHSVLESTIHDVTERYEMERRARTLADAVTYSADAIISLDAAARVTSWNMGAERIFGHKAEEMIGRPYQDLVPPEKMDELCNVIRVRVEQEGHIQGFETVRLHKDGRRIPVSVTVSRLAGNGGPDLGWSTVVRDITDRKREERRHRLLSSITEQSPDALLSLDAEGRITSWNRGAERMFGHEGAEIVGGSWLVLAPEDREADFRGVLSTAGAADGPGDQGPRTVDTLARTRDGRLLPVRLSASVLRAHEGEDPGWSIILRDQTEQKTIAEMSERLREELLSRNRLERIVGVSEPIEQVRERIRKVARFNSSVLLVGQSGTGKEIVASAIHHNSPRHEMPIIKVNCAAIPEHLLESELFGIERNVATGVDGRIGRFEMADGGTLFLDEIADMSLATQAKILRVLQEREFEKVGGKRTIKVDVRIVAATNKDLEEEIKARRFRDDLYYRLNVIQIKLPPLVARREDIDPLIDHFIARFAAENNLPRKRLTLRARLLLNEYDWPGNVRELEHCVERAMVMSEGPEITQTDLPPAILVWKERGVSGERAGSANGVLSQVLDQVERRTVREALERSGWVQARAAKLLGISERSMWYRVKKLGLRPTSK